MFAQIPYAMNDVAAYLLMLAGVKERRGETGNSSLDNALLERAHRAGKQAQTGEASIFSIAFTCCACSLDQQVRPVDH